MIFLLTLFLPFIGSLIAVFLRKRIGSKLALYLPVGFILLSALGSTFILWGFPQELIECPLFEWLSYREVKITWVLMVDSLTAVMMAVVTWVSLAVHIYSLGYMKKDPRKHRFIGYLSLFTFVMLILVSASGLIQLFVGWEGVGLCSYLLIGFWFQKEAPALAALKAFLVNRVGDVFFVLALVILFYVYRSTSFDIIFPQISGQEAHSLLPTLAGFFLLIAAMAKSAQLGLHVWLPDAMEGPTPVSALIHAATMVTAGVFLFIRFEPLLKVLPNVLTVIALIGSITALYGSLMALFQKDIKRIIAYSTCSQLGYMVLAVGMSAYGAALFHLVTHAFFKALLFLGAGSVIHAYDGEQSLDKMGDLGFQAPLTYGAMLVGLLSLTGMPLFAGFFSKDLILASAWAQGGGLGYLCFSLGLLAACITGLYSMRLMLCVFHRKSSQGMRHESEPLLTGPLIFLALMTFVSAYVGTHHWGSLVMMIPHLSHEWWLPFVIVGTSLFGMAIGVAVYRIVPQGAEILSDHFRGVHHFFMTYASFDRLYHRLFVVPFLFLSRRLLGSSDDKIIDPFGPMGLARAIRKAHHALCLRHKGFLPHYIFWMAVGLIIVLACFLMV